MTYHASRERAAAIGLASPATTGLAGCGHGLGIPEGVAEASVTSTAGRTSEDACQLVSHDSAPRAVEDRSRYCAVR